MTHRLDDDYSLHRSSLVDCPPMPVALRFPLLAAVGLALSSPDELSRSSLEAAILGPAPRVGWAKIAEPFVRVAVASTPRPGESSRSDRILARACLDTLEVTWAVACTRSDLATVSQALFTAYRRTVLAIASTHGLSTDDVHEHVVDLCLVAADAGAAHEALEGHA